MRSGASAPDLPVRGHEPDQGEPDQDEPGACARSFRAIPAATRVLSARRTRPWPRPRPPARNSRVARPLPLVPAMLDRVVSRFRTAGSVSVRSGEGRAAPMRDLPGARAEFAAIYLDAFLHPKRAMIALAASPRRLRWGACGVAITVATYTLVYFFLSRNGGRPTAFTPWLAIPAEHYYRANLVLHAPSVLLAWVSAGGFAQLAARALGGRGAFEDTLAALGLGIGVASWATGPHDLVTTFLGYVGALDQRAYEDAMSTPGTWPHRLIWSLMLVYLVAFVALFTRGVGAAHGLRGARAFVAGATGFAVYQAVFVLFNR